MPINKVKVKDFKVIPVSCPRHLKITCECCKYAEQPFELRNPRAHSRAGYGYVNCRGFVSGCAPQKD